MSTSTETVPAYVGRARAIYTKDPTLTWSEIGTRAGCTRQQAAKACADLPGAQRGRGRLPDVAKRTRARKLYGELRNWKAVGAEMGISKQAAHDLGTADQRGSEAA